MYDPGLRRLGYRVRLARPDGLLAMLERAQLRPRPLCRAFPQEGHWIATCPLCGAEDGMYVEPDRMTWTTLCRPGEFGLLELHAVLLTGAAA
jgi:hypothetical protein